MNRLQLDKYTRYLLDQLAAGWVVSEDATYFDLNDALMDGYRRYARETRCFRVDYQTAATIDETTYNLSNFGSGAGSRIFEVVAVGFNNAQLKRVDEEYLTSINPDWRFAVSDTPEYWVSGWSDGQIRVYPSPNTTAQLYVEGYETPDPTTFASNTDSPAIHEDDHRLIAVWAAMLVVVRGAVTDMASRVPALWQEWQAGIEAANARLHPQAGLSVPIADMSGPMTLGQLKRLTQFYLKMQGIEGEEHYDLDTALFDGYRRYAYETGCFKANYTVNAVIGQAEYALSSFTSDASRIFAITAVGFNDLALIRTTEKDLDGLNPHWRFASNSVPLYAVQWGDGQLRLYPPPASASEIYVEGQETPNPLDFRFDSDTPAIHEEDHKLIAMWAAMSIAARGNIPEMAQRTPLLWNQWQQGVTLAQMRVGTFVPKPPVPQVPQA